VNEANRLLKDGMYICSTRTYPKRLKYEPKQCMKCRRWGHFASECHATSDTCGTCGGEHATRDCEESDKRYCISCRSNDHASWDRACPEFQRKSAQFDEMHPENALTYFPTEESWTLNARPERIPLDDRFPSKYAVGSLPPPSRMERQPPTRPIERGRKRHMASKDNGKQGTLDGYIEMQAQTKQVRFAIEDPAEEGQYDSEDDAAADILIQNALCNE
jgi:hypothetical protein